MLRASIEHTGETMRWGSVCQRPREGVPTGLTGGDELIALTDASLSGDDELLARARDDVSTSLGNAATSRAIGVIANFQMMNRLLDATGVPVPRRFTETAELLGL